MQSTRVEAEVESTKEPSPVLLPEDPPSLPATTTPFEAHATKPTQAAR
jgi:hypothetical protein